MGQVLAGKVLFFCLKRDPGLSGSVDFFSDFLLLKSLNWAWVPGQTHRSEWVSLFFLQLLVRGSQSGPSGPCSLF